MGVTPSPSPLSPPIPVIVDLGAGLTMVNWRAAQLVSMSIVCLCVNIYIYLHVVYLLMYYVSV